MEKGLEESERCKSRGARRPWTRLRGPLTVSTALLTLLCACGRDAPPSPAEAPPLPLATGDSASEILLRFIEEDPQTYPPRGAVASWRFGHATGPLLGEWHFSGEAGLEGWQPSGMQVAGGSDSSVDLVPNDMRSFVWREGGFDGSEVYTVEVEVEHASGSSFDPFAGTARAVHLTWFREGRADFVRRPAPPVAQEVGDGQRRIRFLVGGHPEWRGKIERVEVRFTGVQASTEPVRLRRIAFMGPPDPAQATAPPAGEVGKFVLDDVARNALVGSPYEPIVRELEVPAGASLQLAYGVAFAYGAKALFRVQAELPDGETRELFVDRWDGSGEEGSGWRQAEVDLGSLAGQTVRLALRTGHDETTTPGWGLPVWGHPEVRVPPAPGSAVRPNVILLSIDTLRADRLSSYGYERQTSPNLDAWAERAGVRFQNVIAAAAWTLPTHVSMFTGSNAVEHGVQFPPVPAHHVTLAERLRDAGYATMAVTGGVVLAHDFGFMQGFDAYYASLAPHAQALEDEVARATAWLDGAKGRPFFLFFHTYEVHDPFHARLPHFEEYKRSADPVPEGAIWINAPGNEATLARAIEGRVGPTQFRVRNERGPARDIGPDEQRMISDAYDSGIAYMDGVIGGLFDHLRELGLEESTLLVLTSDHGEGLGEHGEYRHRTLYDEILRIPLIVSGPRVPPGRVVNTQVRQVDVTPTILDIVGLPPQLTGAGRSLLPLMEDPGASFDEMAWSYAPTNFEGLSLRVGNRQKYIVNDAAIEELRGRERLFDLDRDAREEEPARTGPEHFRAAARDMLLRHWVGVEIAIENAEETTLRVEIGGHLVASRMRSAEFGETSASLQGTPATISVPAGGAWSGMWLGPDPVTLVGDWAETGRGEPFTFHVDPSKLAEPSVLGWSDGAWAPLAESETAAATIRAVTRGPSDSGSGGAFIDDPAILDQLRDLGYVR